MSRRTEGATTCGIPHEIDVWVALLGLRESVAQGGVSLGGMCLSIRTHHEKSRAGADRRRLPEIRMLLRDGTGQEA
jgi:hypothetical protein